MSASPVPFIITIGDLSRRRAKRGVGKLTPISDSHRLLRAGVEHGGDDHETRGYRAFTCAQNESCDEQTAKILASSVAAESNAPAQDIRAHPFAHWETLECEVLWILKQ